MGRSAVVGSGALDAARAAVAAALPDHSCTDDAKGALAALQSVCQVSVCFGTHFKVSELEASLGCMCGEGSGG